MNRYEHIAQTAPKDSRQWLYAAVRCSYKPEYVCLAMQRLSHLTPRDILILFPPEKIYDGERWQIKDYYSTMRAVADFGCDTPLGDRAFDFLWDYMNPHIKKLIVSYMEHICNECQELTGEDPFVNFMESIGVHPYCLQTDEQGKQYLVGDGKITPVVKPKPKPPRWWRVIEGGR